MPATDPFDPEQLRLFQALGQALIQNAPEHFKSVFCRIEQAPGHGKGRLQYRIGSTEHPNEDTSQPAPALHAAAYQLYRYWTKEGQPFPGVELTVKQETGGNWKNNTRILYQGKPEDVSEEAQDRLWQAVYDAREEFFRSQFGPFPDDIQKPMNLVGVWPGGGIFQFPATKRNGFGICTSFGLSNADLPTPVRVSKHERADQGGQPSFSSTLEGRTPQWVAADRAGYGYEVMIVTPTPTTWPLLPLSWFIQMEILNDVGLLGRVMEHQGLTVESIKIGDGSQSADFLIQLASSPFPEQAQLPNGTMQLLIATRVTREEMNFSLKHGRAALLDRLKQAGVGQISILDRASVVGEESIGTSPASSTLAGQTRKPWWRFWG